MDNKKITENTLIPISAVVILAGGIFWLSSLYVKSDVLAQRMSSIEENIKESEVFQREVIERLARIEEAIKHKGKERR